MEYDKRKGTWSKLQAEKRNYQVICECSCRVSFYPFEHKTKKVCRWCGSVVYINEKEKFKDKLKKTMGIMVS